MNKQVAAALALLSCAVWAAEPSVKVQAEVIFASTAPGTVDPSLQKMRDAMAPKVKYLSMKKVESKKLELMQNKAELISLPNQKQAELTLQGLKENVATVKVKLAPTEAVYSLGRDKSLSIQGGPFEAGDLWLVLSQPK